MKSFIISNGDVTDYEYCKKLIKKDDYIICADGGVRHAYNMRIKPDLIIGDLDSMQQKYIEYYKNEDVKFIKHPTDKDKTDTHLCILKALEFSSEIVFLGALGSRLDHSFANISLLKIGIDKNIKMSIDDYYNQIFLVNKNIILYGNRGDTFSLLPFNGDVEGLCVKGSRYELNNANMEAGDTYGISNLFLDKEVSISIKKGLLMIVKSKD
ncbi:MAG: thiamine diphosphokinase [Firmicutes bacterium]|nr:thiamine diphosphokinase [Bacillota bacterium]